MPICHWCGIDSKNEVVCDWCKRPLDLRSARTGTADSGRSGGSGVDLLADGDDDARAILPRLIVIGTMLVLVAAAAVVFAIVRGNKVPEAPPQNVQAPAPANQEFQAEAKPTHYTPGYVSNSPEHSTPRVILPDPQQMVGKLSVSAPVGETHATIMIDHDGDDTGPKFGISAAALTAFKLSKTKTICMGKVSLYNVSNENVEDYRLVLVSHGHTYDLKTFSGTLKAMKFIDEHTIPSKERVSVPVYAGHYLSKPGEVIGELLLYATPEDNRTQKYRFTLNDKAKTSAQG